MVALSESVESDFLALLVLAVPAAAPAALHQSQKVVGTPFHCTQMWYHSAEQHCETAFISQNIFAWGIVPRSQSCAVTAAGSGWL